MARRLLWLVGPLVGAAGCAPPCHDDGWFQGGCPDDEPSSLTTGEADPPTTTGVDGSGGPISTVSADGGGDTTTGPGTTDGESLCVDVQQIMVSAAPTVELVLDQSSAMAEELDGQPRWDAVEDALLDPIDGVVSQQQSRTRFGLVSYRGLQAGCPVTQSVPAQLDAAGPMSASMGASTPAGANPIANAIEVALEEPLGPRELVLVIGGEPSTCDIPAPLPLQLASTRAAAIEALATAYDAGISTVVLGVGDQILPAFLQDLANAGAGHQAGDPDAPYLTAASQAGLHEALSFLLTRERPCTFALESTIAPGQIPGCEVEIDGATVPPGAGDGWTMPAGQVLQLEGLACESIQEGESSIEVTCGCDVV